MPNPNDAFRREAQESGSANQFRGGHLDNKTSKHIQVPMVVRIENNSRQRAEALDLAWRVFLEFEAPDYAEEGVLEFRRFIEPDAVDQRVKAGEFLMWEAFREGALLGMIATRPPCHIAMLFVDKQHHRRGVAGALLHAALTHYQTTTEYRKMTVNSSPYAVEAYRRMGFEPTDINPASK